MVTNIIAREIHVSIKFENKLRNSYRYQSSVIILAQRRDRVTRSKAFSSSNVEDVEARQREERKGGFGEIPEWNPALYTGSKANLAFNKAYYCTPEPVRSSLKLPSTWSDWKASLLVWIPILQWAWGYKVKYLIGDLMSGFTIGMTHIPQGNDVYEAFISLYWHELH